MNILLLSDIHQRIENLKKIVKIASDEQIDLCIITGDLTNFGEISDVEKVLKEVEKFKVLAIPGNMDTEEVVKVLEKNKMNLHNQKIKINGINFVGFGGGLLNNLGGVLYSEEELKKSLRENLKGDKLFLVTHVPALRSGIDRTKNGMFLGSKSVRNIIEERKPFIHVCGHVHESFGETKIGNTISINIGAVKEGKAMILYLEKETHFKRIDLND